MYITFLQKSFSLLLLWEADKVATVVRESADNELVSADGKKMQGKAIPVKTPYKASDSVVFKPLQHNILGIEIASKLCMVFNSKRFKVSGIDSESSKFELVI